MKKCKQGYYYCHTDKKCKKIPIGYRVGYGGYLRRDDEKNGNGNGKSNGSSNGNGNGGNGSGNGNGGSGGNGGGNGSGGGGVGENVEIRTANGDLYATIIDIVSSDNMKPTLDSKGVWTGTKISEKKSSKYIKEWVQSKISEAKNKEE